MIQRRAFILGLIAAPAIVRIDNIMPIKQVLLRPPTTIHFLPGTYGRDALVTILTEAIHRVTNPVIVVRPDGSIDHVTTRTLQSFDARRMEQVRSLAEEVLCQLKPGSKKLLVKK